MKGKDSVFAFLNTKKLRKCSLWFIYTFSFFYFYAQYKKDNHIVKTYEV